MTLFKTSFWSGIAVFFKLAAGFVISKIIAVYSGPTGLAIIGQFQNLIQTIQTFSGSMVQTGVVKYVAEYRQNDEAKSRILSTALSICVIISITSAILIYAFRGYIAIHFLKSIQYQNIITLFALTISLVSLNGLFLSILNGEREIAKYNISNIANSIIGLIVTSYLIINYSLFGGLLALVLNQSIVFFFTLYIVTKCKWFKIKMFIQGLDKDSLYKLSQYALMTIISCLLLPTVQLIIRQYIGSHLSWEEAGYWQGISRISDAYLLLITTTLSVYYLPKLSELQTGKELRHEILHGYKVILPSIIMLAGIVFLLKDIIIMLLYSRDFLPMISLFKYQLIGDVLKIGSWLLAYLMLAKAMTKLFIVTEILFSFSYVVLTIICVHFIGLVGTTLAFAINYALYWICMAFITKNYVKV